MSRPAQCRRVRRSLLDFVCLNDILSPISGLSGLRFLPVTPQPAPPVCRVVISFSPRTFVDSLLGTDKRYGGWHLASQFYCSTTVEPLAQAPICCQSDYPRRELACQSSSRYALLTNLIRISTHEERKYPYRFAREAFPQQLLRQLRALILILL